MEEKEFSVKKKKKINHFCISQIIYQAATEGKLKERMLKTLFFLIG